MNLKVGLNLLIFLLIVFAVFAFAEDKNEMMVGNDRDEHGCIGSAGYSWCEEKQKCLRVWEEACNADYNETELNENPVSNGCICTMEYAPVCGTDGRTYGNVCAASCSNAAVSYVGECRNGKDNNKSDEDYGCISGYKWCEGEKKCISLGDYCDENSSLGQKGPCICTEEYSPVCAVIPNSDCNISNCPDEMNCAACENKKQTFLNACLAECEGATVIENDTCDSTTKGNDDSDFCGGIAAIPCNEGYTCKFDGNYPDAGGKCVYDCPQYVSPICDENMAVIVKVDDKGCKKPVCSKVVSTSMAYSSDFFLGADWSCSNGEEFKEKSDKCMPYAFWKEKARKTCSQFDFNICPTAAGGQDTDSNISKTCISTVPYVKLFDASGPCKVACDSFTDDEGCKNVDCGDGEIKRYCDGECKKQSIEEIVKIKEKCSEKDGQIIVKTNDIGCTKYFCDKLVDGIEDTNGTLNYSDTCTLLDELPNEKYASCEENKGKLLVKTNKDNCITVLECVSTGKAVDLNSKKLNKEILNDSAQLLGISLKLEELAVELNKAIAKLGAISDYYSGINDTNASIKYEDSKEMLKTALVEIDALNAMIKEKASNFSEADALEVKNSVQSIRAELLNRVLMKLLD